MSFTHDLELPWLLPGVDPTHRQATVQVIAIVGFERGRIRSQRIHWDHATLSAQSGSCPREVIAMISDDALRQMTGEERASLRRRLAALDSHLPPLSAGDERRRRFVILLTVASAGLVPWIVLLGLTLPHRYLAGHWTLTWVGFDTFLLTGLALTAWLAWRRRQAVMISAFITGALLVCDAWFDITTASGRIDMITAVASAVVLELPLAGLLFAVAAHLLRLTVRRAQVADGLASAPCRLLKVPLIGVPGGSPT